MPNTSWCASQQMTGGREVSQNFHSCQRTDRIWSQAWAWARNFLLNWREVVTFDNEFCSIFYSTAHLHANQTGWAYEVVEHKKVLALARRRGGVWVLVWEGKLLWMCTSQWVIRSGLHGLNVWSQDRRWWAGRPTVTMAPTWRLRFLLQLLQRPSKVGKSKHAPWINA